MTTGRRFISMGRIAILTCGLTALSASPMPAQTPTPIASPDPRFRVGDLLFSDDFQHGLESWTAELENGGTVAARDGGLTLDVPAGATVWFKPKLEGPLLIEYQATVVGNGAPNDRVSDLNCFWMANDSRSPESVFGYRRSGKFADYNQLRTYYVGLGGNSNTTTRFRRYIGDVDTRPLLPEHDLRGKADLITPNVAQTIRLVANGSLIQFYRDGKRLFELNDPQPYTNGWFGFRTVTSHLIFKNFRVYRLLPA